MTLTISAQPTERTERTFLIHPLTPSPTSTYLDLLDPLAPPVAEIVELDEEFSLRIKSKIAQKSINIHTFKVKIYW